MLGNSMQIGFINFRYIKSQDQAVSNQRSMNLQNEIFSFHFAKPYYIFPLTKSKKLSGLIIEAVASGYA